MSLFKQDLSQESILQRFLDLKYTQADIHFCRLHEPEFQQRGVDVVLLEGDNLLKVDEKAQLHYLNKSLPTFAFELDYLKNGKLKEGWLFDPSKTTEAYALVFDIQLCPGLSKLTQPTDIASCEVLFLNRQHLIDTTQQHGLTREFCQQQSYMLRQNPEQRKIVVSPNFNFQISTQLAEAPVNLIVRRTFLKSISWRVL
ncbi:hypothetical protein [Pontibacter roseus]|uniref:hypothetical protein n=1 Tax=Pontibacter roseus TaxID=336989 RepID=UPI000364C3AD|nr:hypothetical protein [Pontibacter roseus]